ncbi:MAG: IS256 family transposase, partial [bacterium]
KGGYTMNPLDYSKSKFNDIFSDVNILFTDNIEETISDYVIRGLKRLFEGAMKAEVRGYLKAQRYERTSERVDYRNGYRHRNLVTAFGLIKDLVVPRTVKGGYQTVVFRRYQRRWDKVNRFIREIFIGGVSTREVGWVMRSLLNKEVSASTVSSITKALDKEVSKYHKRFLSDEYVYLFLDGVVQRVVSCGRAVKKLVLVAYGIKRDGHREVIDYRLAKSESEHDWTVLLNDLYRRGLQGEHLRLVITDGCPGLHAALDMIYPHVKRQRCWVHKLRNVANYIPRRYQNECLPEAKGIYSAPSYRVAVKRFKVWCRKWRSRVPKAVHCLEKDIEDLLVFFENDKKLWVKIRTTNMIERLFKELRKRTRPMSLFTNEASCDRITYALFTKYNKKWKDRRYVVIN